MPNQTANTKQKEHKLPGLIRGVICGVGTILLLMLLFSFFIAKFSLSPSVVPILLIPILILGGMVSGYAASSLLKKDGLLNGAIVGGILALVELVAVIAATGASPTGNALTKGVILLTSAMVGGILGVNKKRKSKR